MNRIAFAFIFAPSVFSAFAATNVCSVAGTAYDVTGRPLRTAVVRLVNLQTREATFSAADAHARFAFNDVAADADRYRLDVLSGPTVVTGSRIPTRSILGMSQSFTCTAGQLAHEDVRAQVE